LNTRLELENPEKAVSAFGSAVEETGRALSDPQLRPGLVPVLQAGVIRHFEFTYDLCRKRMKRWLDLNLSPDLTDGIPRKELFRLAVENTQSVNFP
jgi:hypothetical protein